MMKLSKEKWADHQGSEVYLYTADNGQLRISFSNFGGIVKSVIANVDGTERNLVLGYEDFDSYLSDQYYLGCVVGRFANRIGDGLLKIDDTRWQLSMNEAARRNHLHGGYEGFNKKVFSEVEVENTPGRVAVAMRYLSPHLEEGYPGNVGLTLTYSLNSRNEFLVEFRAETDLTTHVNLTQHTYFNLAGVGTIDDHELLVESNKILEPGDRFLPTGNILSATNDFDFSHLKKVTSSHNTYYLFSEINDGRRAVLNSPGRDVQLSVSTSYPGLLLYTGDYLDRPFQTRAGLCLECQFAPDAPNLPHLPSTLLNPAGIYDHYVKFQFHCGTEQLHNIAAPNTIRHANT